MEQGVFTWHSKAVSRVCAGTVAALVGVVLASGTAPFPILTTQQAEAADVVYVASPSELRSTGALTEIELLSDAYDQARGVATVCDVKAAASQYRVDILETKIPVQQARSDAAMVELYKMQEGRYEIVEMLLASESLDDFIKQTEYIESISRANLETINELKETRERLATLQDNLEAARAESDAALNIASEELDSARAARAARQSSGLAGSGVSFDGADWYMTEEEFIEAWAPRIDGYLAGSPLSGQGANFARSAWRYCVDPRWSPAISNTESSKGAHCIRPHNAWGWGAADSDPYGLASQWDSWEEAIDAHVRGLSDGYGYTISPGGAQAYCPSTWEEWYNNTRGEMEQI